MAPDGELAALVTTLAEIDRLYARAMRQAGAVDGGRAVAEEGMTVELAVQLHAGVTRSDVNTVLTGAEVLARMPATFALFERGVLSWGHVRAVISGARRLDAGARERLDRQLGEEEERLAAMDPQQRLWALDDALRANEPRARDEQRERQQLQETFLVFAPRLDGSASAYGEFDPESFTTVSHALAQEADTPQAAPPPGDGDDGMPAYARTPPTTRARQLGEALVRVCGRNPATGRGRETAGGRAPTRATVVVDLDRVTDRVAATLQPAAAARPATITRRTLERLSCDAALDVVVARGGELLTSRRYAPDIPIATRRAVFARDGGCRFPGCTAPPAWGEIHHVTERSRHLDHAPGNLVTLCRRHHQIVHRRGWSQTLRDDGTYTLRRRGRRWTTVVRREQRLRPRQDRLGVSEACEKPGRRDGPGSRDGPRLATHHESEMAPLPF